MTNKIITNAAKQAQRLRMLVAAINHSILDIVEEAVGFIKQKMEVEPPPPTYPINWDNPKQQRFVMRKLRQENNLPYTRTHAYVQGFVQERFDNGISLSNAHPAAAIGGFYMGWQSNIHKGNWQSLTMAVDEVMAILPQKIQKVIDKETIAILKVD